MVVVVGMGVGDPKFTRLPEVLAAAASEVCGEEEDGRLVSLQIHRKKSKTIRPSIGAMTAKLTSFCLWWWVGKQGELKS